MEKLNPKHKSFVLYYDQSPMFDALTNEEAGELIKLVCNLQNDPEPLIVNPGIKVAFAQIRSRIIENDKNWSLKSENAKKAAYTRWEKSNDESTTKYDWED